jgi:hypothetical protein
MVLPSERDVQRNPTEADPIAVVRAATAFGIAAWSFHRWMRQPQRRRPFRPIVLRETAPPARTAT